MFTPFPSIYNPFLVKEPQYTAPQQLAAQQTVYPQMTNKNEMQMFDEALIENGLDRINPDKSFYTDPTSSPQIVPREYNQPNAIQQRLANIPNIVKNIEDARNNSNDMGGAGVMANTVPEPTPYLDQVMGKTETPYTMNYVPFKSEEAMQRYYNPRQEEPELTVENPYNKTYKKDDEGFELIYDENVKSDRDMSYVKPTPKNKFGTPEAYYLGKSMLDATALINNMVQPQPPSIQMKLPHYERQRLNPEPYDTMRSEMRNQSTQAYRLQRENISQASDLMKGLAAVTSGTQQGLMQVGMQQAGAEQQIQGINQQISMQEQGAQTQILNQEATTNYQIQAQAQQFKDQMVSAQLARLGDTAGAYAKYSNMKDIVSKQEAINKSAIQSTNEIQNAMLQWQMHKDAIDSEEYKSAWGQHWNKSLNQMSEEKLKDNKYNLVKEYYGETNPSYGDYRRRATDPTFVQDYHKKRNSYDMFQKLYPSGIAPDRSKYGSDDEYNTALADFNRYEKESKAYGEDKTYKAFEQEQDFWTTISNERNESEERKKFADQYMRERGYYTNEQLMIAIRSSLERSQQSLNIGG